MIDSPDAMYANLLRTYGEDIANEYLKVIRNPTPPDAKPSIPHVERLARAKKKLFTVHHICGHSVPIDACCQEARKANFDKTSRRIALEAITLIEKGVRFELKEVIRNAGLHVSAYEARPYLKKWIAKQSSALPPESYIRVRDAIAKIQKEKGLLTIATIAKQAGLTESIIRRKKEIKVLLQGIQLDRKKRDPKEIRSLEWWKKSNKPLTLAEATEQELRPISLTRKCSNQQSA